MISFKGRCETIRTADRITRTAKSVYPHISESMSHILINKQTAKLGISDLSRRLSDLRARNFLKINQLRNKEAYGADAIKDVIYMLKNSKIGNCYEEAILSQMIGKINGIKNIYPTRIFFNRNRSGAQIQLDHIVSVISEKPLKENIMYKFKNKEAVIIDPWLGITDFAKEYFTKLKNNFSNLFQLLPDESFAEQSIKSKTKTPAEFHKAKQQCFKPGFSMSIDETEYLSEADIKNLKEEFPELILKK